MWTFLQRKFWHPRDVVVADDGFTFTTTRVPTVRKVADTINGKGSAIGTAFVWGAFVLVLIVISAVWHATI